MCVQILVQFTNCYAEATYLHVCAGHIARTNLLPEAAQEPCPDLVYDSKRRFTSRCSCKTKNYRSRCYREDAKDYGQIIYSFENKGPLPSNGRKRVEKKDVKEEAKDGEKDDKIEIVEDEVEEDETMGDEISDEEAAQNLEREREPAAGPSKKRAKFKIGPEEGGQDISME